jgi:hypothetical protein
MGLKQQVVRMSTGSQLAVDSVNWGGGGDNNPKISTTGVEFLEQLSKNQPVTLLYGIGCLVIRLK